jgi:beige protein homolog 1
LLLVNKFSGRSFNDLSQYPIFPWVIHDYSTPTFKEFSDNVQKGTSETLRDLTLHTGILSTAKKEYAENQFKKDDDMRTIYGDDPFHLKFGYSNRMFSLAYLIRLEPFTDSFIQVNKNLDNPDRIMYSISDQYHSVLMDN